MRRPALACTMCFAASLAPGSHLMNLACGGYVPIAASEECRVETLVDSGGAAHVLEDDDARLFVDGTETKPFDDPSVFVSDAWIDDRDHLTGGSIHSGVTDSSFEDPAFDGPIPIPLPGAVWTGIVGLAAVAWAKRRRAMR